MTARCVPREKIPWFPTIGAGACTGCRVCLEFCQHGVFAWDAQDHVVRVEAPFHCLVGCNGCEDKCAAGAITFPDQETISDLIKKIRAELNPSD